MLALNTEGSPMLEILGYAFLGFVTLTTLATTVFAFWITFNFIREDLKNMEKR